MKATPSGLGAIPKQGVTTIQDHGATNIEERMRKDWGEPLPTTKGFAQKLLPSGARLILYHDGEHYHMLHSAPSDLVRNHPRCRTCSACVTVEKDGDTAHGCTEYGLEITDPDRFYCMNHDFIIVAANNSLLP